MRTEVGATVKAGLARHAVAPTTDAARATVCHRGTAGMVARGGDGSAGEVRSPRESARELDNGRGYYKAARAPTTSALVVVGSAGGRDAAASTKRRIHSSSMSRT